jgi:hypothetical protein
MSDAEHRDPTSVRGSGKSTDGWQRLLLPLMVGTIVVGGAFFLIASALDIAFINRHVARHESVDLQPALLGLDRLSSAKDEGALVAARFRMLATLEASALDRRYHQANSLLLFSVLTRYLGFMTGMILSLVGAGFILGKIREAPTTADAETLAGKWGIKSTSPGLLLATLGTILMITAMQVQFDIKVSDVPIFLLEQMPAVQQVAPADSIRVVQQERQLIDRVRAKLNQGSPTP